MNAHYLEFILLNTLFWLTLFKNYLHINTSLANNIKKKNEQIMPDQRRNQNICSSLIEYFNMNCVDETHDNSFYSLGDLNLSN